MDEDLSRQTRRFSAAILTYGKGKRRRMAGKRPLRRRSTVVNTGSTAFVPVAQMGGALSDAFFRRKYLFSAEESYQSGTTGTASAGVGQV